MSSLQIPERGHWARLPTPVQKLEKLSAELGIQLWIKRDDQTGFELSGNKVRKLEFLAQDALKNGANTLITCGGVQSNHCRATAVLAARLGLRCVLLLRGEEPKHFRSNFLLDKVFGAEIFFLTPEQYYEEMGELRMMLESQVRSQGGKAYFIPEGGSNAIGSLGYANAFQEIEQQRRAGEIPGLDAPFDSIVFAHGSGGTQAGLILGKLGAGDEPAGSTRIVGVNVCYDAKKSFQLVKDALWSAIQTHHFPLSFMPGDIELLDGFLGDGYAKSRPEERKFLLHMARTEGVLVDPVYAGKALYGLCQTAKAQPGYFGKNVLFLHTGGGFGFFQLDEEWMGEL